MIGIAIAKRVVSKKGPHDLASFQKVLEVNVLGTFNVIRLAGTLIRQSRPLSLSPRCHINIYSHRVLFSC
jgi:hypothetical protein